MNHREDLIQRAVLETLINPRKEDSRWRVGHGSQKDSDCGVENLKLAPASYNVPFPTEQDSSFRPIVNQTAPGLVHKSCFHMLLLRAGRELPKHVFDEMVCSLLVSSFFPSSDHPLPLRPDVISLKQAASQSQI
jgi:hypothetical protein